MNMYSSVWNPPGYRKNWERTPMSPSSAQETLGSLCAGKAIDACAWFGRDGELRVLVVDTDAGKRHIYRSTARGFSFETVAR